MRTDALPTGHPDPPEPAGTDIADIDAADMATSGGGDNGPARHAGASGVERLF